MRAMAALMVFTYHSWEGSNSPQLHPWHGSANFFAPIQFLNSGVDVFIVLSGLCLFLPYVQRTRPWQTRAYATRRVWRIIPPYYAAIGFCTALPFALVIVYRLVGHPAHWQHLPSLFQYATHLTFTQTLFPSTWAGIQGAFWTIGLEAQLYVVFPFLVLAYRRWGLIAIWLAIASSLLYRVILNPFISHEKFSVGGFLLTVTFLGRWMEFGTGMLLAWLIVSIHSDDEKPRLQGMVISRTPSYLWVPSGLACIALGFMRPVYGLTWIPTQRNCLLNWKCTANHRRLPHRFLDSRSVALAAHSGIGSRILQLLPCSSEPHLLFRPVLPEGGSPE